jgi:hypothetical protein
VLFHAVEHALRAGLQAVHDLPDAAFLPLPRHLLVNGVYAAADLQSKGVLAPEKGIGDLAVLSFAIRLRGKEAAPVFGPRANVE